MPIHEVFIQTHIKLYSLLGRTYQHMNKKGFFPGFVTILRVIMGAVVYVLLTKLFALTPMPEQWIWKVALVIVIGMGLLSFRIPII